MKPAMVKRVAYDLRVHPLGHLWRKPQRRYKSTEIIGGTRNGGSLSISQRRRKIPNAMAVARPCSGVFKLFKQNEKSNARSRNVSQGHGGNSNSGTTTVAAPT